MVNIEHKFVFVHIPKTGGTSIETRFDSDAATNIIKHKHWNLEQIEAGYDKADFYSTDSLEYYDINVPIYVEKQLRMA